MSPVNQFKQLESSFAEKLRKKIKGLWKTISGAFANVFRIGKQRFTVMLIPHSERKIFNFQINTFTILFLTLLLTVIISGFFFLSTHFTGSSHLISEKSQNLEDAEASLESIREELNDALKTAKTFTNTLYQTLDSLGISKETDGLPDPSGGDLSALKDLEEVGEGQLRELHELQNLVTMLNNSLQPLSEVGDAVQAQQKLLSDIPNLWPVIGGAGRVTLEWGPAIHPITHQWYMHKGIDIAYGPGTPVVASANGKVREVGNDRLGYGLYLWIDHPYGIKTRYSHLQKIYVNEGDIVFQGDKIGTMGSSGTSTGTHLDFQVWIGSQLVDPSIFLHISNRYDRWFGNGRERVN